MAQIRAIPEMFCTGIPNMIQSMFLNSAKLDSPRKKLEPKDRNWSHLGQHHGSLVCAPNPGTLCTHYTPYMNNGPYINLHPNKKEEGKSLNWGPIIRIYDSEPGAVLRGPGFDIVTS